MALEPQLIEAEASEDLGFLFKRLGEICFSPASSQAFPGPACSLAVAGSAGVVFFSDAQGECARVTEAIVACRRAESPLAMITCCRSSSCRCAGVYACKTAELLPRLQKWNSDE